MPSFKGIECEERNGLMCTTVNQTIIDLLEQNGDVLEYGGILI